MHSHDFLGNYGNATVIANSDFSGDVRIGWGGPGPGIHEWAHYTEVPGELLFDILKRMIEYKLGGDLGEKVAQVVLDEILSP